MPPPQFRPQHRPHRVWPDGRLASVPARLMLTTNFGRTFTSIGPKTGGLTEPDSIFFLGRDHGWFATFSVLTLHEKVYRTSDGGRHWESFAAPGHNLAGGSADSLQFLNPRDGFLTAHAGVPRTISA